MSQKPVPRWLLLLLAAGAVLLPIVIAVLWGVSALLIAMGDASGGGVVKCVALAAGILWVVELVCLVLAQTLNSLSEPDGPTDSSS